MMMKETNTGSRRGAPKPSVDSEVGEAHPQCVSASGGLVPRAAGRALAIALVAALLGACADAESGASSGEETNAGAEVDDAEDTSPSGLGGDDAEGSGESVGAPDAAEPADSTEESSVDAELDAAGDAQSDAGAQDPDTIGPPDVSEPDAGAEAADIDGGDIAAGGESTDASDSTGEDAGDDGGPDATVDAGEAADATDPAQWAGIQCGDSPPPGAELAADPKPYTGGTCPTLVADGVTQNEIVTGGTARKFVVIAPQDLQPGETLPVLFAWHWLKGEAEDFVEQGELLQAVADQRFVAVIPESKNDLVVEIPFVNTEIAFPWPFLSLIPNSRIEEEHLFFDDMLACVAEQFPIDKECVSVAGVSAGALYGAQLAAARSEHIASFISLSGGIRSDQPFVNSFLANWESPPHPMPMLVLWGGPTDSCALLNFQAASNALQAKLNDVGQFLVECVHNCGHGVPPIDPPPGESRFAFLWEFAWSHPYWLPVGGSPWLAELPGVTPEWCAIGSGNAQIRTGACDEPGCPL
jgi:poly(3-hydroxybutyrate) depolymerase